MSEIHETPIIHGTMNVSSLASNLLFFNDGSSMSGVDDQLDINSSNPLSNSAIASAISSIDTPDVNYFVFHGIMNPSASHDATGEVAFPTILKLSSNVAPLPLLANPVTYITLPVAGTYSIYYKTTAYNSNDIVSTNIRVNNSQLAPSPFEGRGILTHTTTYYSSHANDLVTLYSNNETSAHSELLISLFKKS
jgi:hypothetical protein